MLHVFVTCYSLLCIMLIIFIQVDLSTELCSFSPLHSILQNKYTTIYLSTLLFMDTSAVFNHYCYSTSLLKCSCPNVSMAYTLKLEFFICIFNFFLAITPNDFNCSNFSTKIRRALFQSSTKKMAFLESVVTGEFTNTEAKVSFLTSSLQYYIFLQAGSTLTGILLESFEHMEVFL